MATIKFSQDLYTQHSIQSAIEQFKDFGVFRFSSRGKYYHVDVPDSGQADGPGFLIHEFKNYVLYLTIAHANN